MNQKNKVPSSRGIIRQGIKTISSLLRKIIQTIVFISKGFNNAFNFFKFNKKKRIHFFINIIIGIVIALSMHYLEHTSLGESIIDKLFDHFIRAEAKEAVQEKQKIKTSPILFVDIDHETYQDWGEPLITPRDKLASILETAYQGMAKVIILDILLEDKSSDKDADQKLRSVLENILHDNKNNITKIIFPQRIGVQCDLKKNQYSDLFEEGINYNNNIRKFYRVVPRVSATHRDDIVRYWNLYSTYVDNNGSKKILWGIPILTVLLAIDGNINVLFDLEKEILSSNQNRFKSFKSTITLRNGKTIKVTDDKHFIYLQRIRYSLIPSQFRNQDQTITDLSKGNLFQINIKFDQLPYYKDFIKKKIIIIGNSSPDVGDIHQTPVGEMAGIYILGNAINTILTKKQPTPPPRWINLLFEIIVIILAAYAFLYLSSLLAQVLVSLIILVGLGYIGYLYFLNTGVFLNFGFAIVGMSIHRIAANIETMIEKKGTKE